MFWALLPQSQFKQLNLCILLCHDLKNMECDALVCCASLSETFSCSQGDSRKIPKAVLQKLCQKLGWEPPKYAKLSGKEDTFQYSVSILRTARGRGKSRKAGGLISIKFPDNGESSKSVEVQI